MSETIEPHTFIILGGTGDLARRKLLPAVYRLTRQDMLDRWCILGVARGEDMDDESYRAWVREALVDAGFDQEELAAWCDRCLYYQPSGSGVEGWKSIAARIDALEQEHELPQNRAFYLALPPKVFSTAVTGMGAAGLNKSRGWTRVVFEKPFGQDLASAQDLNRAVHEVFDETQIYRIDHYLGKETVQNLLVFRFANPIFEALWNRERVEHIQITVSEDLGVGTRAGYYDQSGALRDMVQNHLTQLMTLIAMEIPVRYDADFVRNEKVKVLRSIRPLDLDNVVFGQYTAGRIGGEEVRGYQDAPGVADNSINPTYVALKLEVANWRWAGVPFYLRTGKRLPRRQTEIAVTFRQPPVPLFANMRFGNVEPDVLLLTLQPDEGFSLLIDVKRPGQPPSIDKLPLTFQYDQAYEPLQDAYVTLLHDLLEGDQTLFVHAHEVEAAWELYTPLLAQRFPLHKYAAGSEGPLASDKMLARSGHVWRPI